MLDGKCRAKDDSVLGLDCNGKGAVVCSSLHLAGF